jgi:hypothetical protein
VKPRTWRQEYKLARYLEFMPLTPTPFSLGNSWGGMGVSGGPGKGSLERVGAHFAFHAAGVGPAPAGAGANLQDLSQDLEDRVLLRGE